MESVSEQTEMYKPKDLQSSALLCHSVNKKLLDEKLH